MDALSLFTLKSFIAPEAGLRGVVEFEHSTGDPLPATERVACDGL